MLEVFKKQIQMTQAKAHWSRIGLSPHHGINIHLSSLHSKESCGIGEFPDLIPLLHWLKKTGFDVIQLLPLNDSGKDPSPYNPASTLALNPAYLGLSALPYVSSNTDLLQSIRKMQQAKKPKRVDYPTIYRIKIHFLRQYLEKFGEKIKKQPAFSTFVKNNSWLEAYALFKVLADKHGSEIWAQWPEEHKNLIQSKRQILLKTHRQDIEFYILLQYLLFIQFKNVKSVADKLNIKIMGDIPFLISPDSYDAWEYRHYFNFELSVGSPPDKDFTPEGQDWQLPAYNWKAIEDDEFSWWKMRLKCAQPFYHMYRVDHVIGFFRVWAMKWGKKPKTGAYVPSEPELWLSHGIKVLSMLLKSSPMLPIGEDLLKGLPQMIRDCLSALGICGTRVARWEILGDGNTIPFSLYHPLSVSTLSTHDTDLFESWWKKAPKQARPLAKYKGWSYPCTIDKKKRFEILRDIHHSSSLFHINLLQEYLAFFPKFTHSNLSEERINFPGTISPRNWSYRFIPSVEEITEHKGLLQLMKDLIS